MGTKKLQALPPAKVIEKKNILKGKRANFESIWQGVADYIVPIKNDIQNVTTPGQPIYNHLLDSSGVNSNELLAGALHGMLTNPAGYFFGLTTGNPELDAKDAVRMYVQTITRRMHEVLNQSNFHTEVHEMYIDLTGFGNAAMSMEEDPETIVRFASRPIKEIFIEENSRGVVDCIYRCYELDPRGLVDEFGLESLPAEIQKEYNEAKECMYEIIHAVYPARRVGPNYQATKFKFVSQYILVKKKLNLAIEGFYESPWLFPRWTKRSGEAYGRGCGEKALPEVKCLNMMTDTTLRAAQKVVDPPLQAPDDGFMLPLVTRPAGMNFYRAGSQDRIEPIFNGAQIDFGYQAIEIKKAQVRESFFIDQLKLRDGPQMTATEVMERVEQALRFLGPQLGRQQSEFLKPLISRLFAIMDRRGLIPETPAELLDENGKVLELKVQYSSVMAMAQRASELQNIGRYFASLAPLISLKPETADNINTDAGAKYIGKLLNIPQEFLHNQQTVQTMRQARAQAQKEMMDLQTQTQEMDNASKAAGATAKIMPKGNKVA